AEAKRGKVEAGHGARGRVDVWTCGRVDVWTCGRRSGERAEDGRSGRWEALRQAQGPGWLSPVIGHGVPLSVAELRRSGRRVCFSGRARPVRPFDRLRDRGAIGW